MESISSTPILVTGATGYISSHVIKLLLEQGYKVRGTVRSLINKEKYEFLYKLAPEKNDNLTLVEADLLDSTSWLSAVEGCDYILHIASPIPPSVPIDENEIIKPAVEGTINVLNAALEKKCKKVVITSSCLAIVLGNEHKTVTEEDWADITKTAHYPKSKILAEKAAWEFYEKNKDAIQMTVVNPSLVLGPTFTKHNNSSEALLGTILGGTFPGIPSPDCTFVIADVRDVAVGHIKALFAENSNGKRYIIANEPVSTEGMVNILKSEFGKYGYTFPSKKMTKEELIASGNQIAIRTATTGRMGTVMKICNERSLNELGMKYHKIADTLIDMGYSLIKNKVVEDKCNDEIKK